MSHDQDKGRQDRPRNGSQLERGNSSQLGNAGQRGPDVTQRLERGGQVPHNGGQSQQIQNGGQRSQSVGQQLQGGDQPSDNGSQSNQVYNGGQLGGGQASNKGSHPTNSGQGGQQNFDNRPEKRGNGSVCKLVCNILFFKSSLCYARSIL